MARTQLPSHKVALALGSLGLVAGIGLTFKDAALAPATFSSGGPAPMARQLAPSAPPLGTVSEKLWLGALSQDKMQRVLSRHVANLPFFASASEVESARAQPLLFTPMDDVDKMAQSPLATARRLNDERLWMAYDMRTLASRVEGDRFVMPLPDHPQVTAEIDSVKLVDGHYRWEGRLQGLDGHGSFSITQAWDDQYAAGTLRTPYGDYVLEAKSGLGWVAPSAMDFDHTATERESEDAHRH